MASLIAKQKGNQLYYYYVVDLGGRPKPANEGHLKTGQ